MNSSWGPRGWLRRARSAVGQVPAVVGTVVRDPTALARLPLPAPGTFGRAARPVEGREPAWRVAPRGLIVQGALWPGGRAEVVPRGSVVVDGTGRIAYVGPAAEAPMWVDAMVVGVHGSSWVGPALVDTHVHLGRYDLDEHTRLGVGAVRTLDGATVRARADAPGPRLLATAFPAFPGVRRRGTGSADPRWQVQLALSWGASAITVGMGETWGELPRETVLALVDAAHDVGLPVVVHTRSATFALRAVDAGADELTMVPTELLEDGDLEAIVASGVGVTPLVQAAYREGHGGVAARNVGRLHVAGVPLRYGSGLGCEHGQPGVDVRELERLAAAGLGRWGALRAATEASARSPGLTPLGISGRLVVGETARVVVLPGDPLVEPAVWRSPTATCIGSSLHRVG